MKILNVAFASGIGDTLWVMTKMQSLLKQEYADKLNISVCSDLLRRSEEFLRSFKFVNEVKQSPLSINENVILHANGHWNYVETQRNWNGFDWFIQCNSHLENGQRLEDWHSEWEINWNVFNEYKWREVDTLAADAFEKRFGPYCVFYFGPEAGNTISGHNRGPIWKPEDWFNLQKECGKLGLNVIGVGAYYDESYYNNHLQQTDINIVNLIGKCEIGRTLSILKRAKFAIGYQSGIIISAPYLNVPGVGFWRPYGDSTDGNLYISFDEQMAECWVNPEILKRKKWLGAIYGKQSVDTIITFIKENNWV